MHKAKSMVILRWVGVGSSKDANSVQATAAKATAPAPSGHAVAIQKKAHKPIAIAAASADNNAMPGSGLHRFRPDLRGRGANIGA